MTRGPAIALALAIGAAVPLAGAARAAEPTHPVWERYLDQLPPDARLRAEESIQRMAPEHREEVLRRFEALDESQRDLLVRSASGEKVNPPDPAPRDEEAEQKLSDQLARWQELPPAERERIGRNVHAWAEKTPAERAALRERLRRFQALPADEQEALVAQRFANRPAAERSEILARLRAGPDRD